MNAATRQLSQLNHGGLISRRHPAELLVQGPKEPLVPGTQSHLELGCWGCRQGVGVVSDPFELWGSRGSEPSRPQRCGAAALQGAELCAGGSLPLVLSLVWAKS